MVAITNLYGSRLNIDQQYLKTALGYELVQVNLLCHTLCWLGRVSIPMRDSLVGALLCCSTSRVLVMKLYTMLYFSASMVHLSYFVWPMLANWRLNFLVLECGVEQVIHGKPWYYFIF